MQSTLPFGMVGECVSLCRPSNIGDRPEGFLHLLARADTVQSFSMRSTIARHRRRSRGIRQRALINALGGSDAAIVDAGAAEETGHANRGSGQADRYARASADCEAGPR